MDLELARLYSTPGREVAEVEASNEMNKQAALELFIKVATENNIDLTTLSDVQIEQLWENAWGTKIAELPPQFAAHMAGKGKGDKDGDDKGEKKDEKHEEKKDDKEKKAAAELAEVQDEHTKLAFADKMGRTMAHAFVNELEQIKVAQAKAGSDKTASVETPAAAPATAPVEIKLAGALEQLAVNQAMKIATEAKLDAGDVSRKLAARAELGFAPSTKLATAPQGNLPAAVEIRALEMLEQAGYPVTWA